LVMNEMKAQIAQCADAGIEVIGPGKISRRYCFPPSFLGFSGHFPGYPVLPAFVQIMAAMAVVEELKGCPCELSSMERAKFRTEVRPGQTISVECREYGPEDEPGFEVKIITAEGVTAASFIMTIMGRK
jgi:3-hydroxyacyl-[acyl-carrier-protein] dehydratase